MTSAPRREPDPESVARAMALRMLTAAPRSRHQIAEAMARRGVDDAVAVRVLDRLTEVGLIDDAEYANMLVRSRREGRGLGRIALSAELRRAGVGEAETDGALAGIDPDAEEALARDLVRRRWRADVAPDVQARRTLAMLARKGYPPGLSRRVVRAMVDHSDEEPWKSAADT